MALGPQDEEELPALLWMDDEDEDEDEDGEESSSDEGHVSARLGVSPKGGLPAKRAVLKPNTAVRDDLLRRLQVAKDKLARLPKGGVRQELGSAPVRALEQSGTKHLVAEPWDKLRGRQVDGRSEYDVEVPANRERLSAQASMSLAQHWAPDCSTFSRALERPIPGAPAGKGPRPLRSRQHPRGLPWQVLQENFGTKTAKVIQEKIKLHNMMAEITARACLKAAKEGRFFCVENPGNSYLWQLEEFKELAKLKGVVWFTLHNCAFGATRRKYTGIMTNVPGLKEALERRCEARGDDDPCDFSGEAHESWSAKWTEGYGHTKTKDSAEYPKAMCTAMAGPFLECAAAAPALAGRTPFAFLEVFSGPSAPLTQAVRRAAALMRQEPDNWRMDLHDPTLPPRA